MPNELVTVRLRRDHALFLEANLTLMADRTRTAMMPPDLPNGRRAGLYKRAILLERLNDAVHAALLDETSRTGFLLEPSDEVIVCGTSEGEATGQAASARRPISDSRPEKRRGGPRPSPLATVAALSR